MIPASLVAKIGRRRALTIMAAAAGTALYARLRPDYPRFDHSTHPSHLSDLPSEAHP